MDKINSSGDRIALEQYIVTLQIIKQFSFDTKKELAIKLEEKIDSLINVCGDEFKKTEEFKELIEYLEFVTKMNI